MQLSIQCNLFAVKFKLKIEELINLNKHYWWIPAWVISPKSKANRSNFKIILLVNSKGQAEYEDTKVEVEVNHKCILLVCD